MLFLNRKRREVVYITNEESQETLELVINGVDGGVVSLGFEDPEKKFTILRKEVKMRQDVQRAMDAQMDTTTITAPNAFYKDQLPFKYKEKYRRMEKEALYKPNKDLQELFQSINKNPLPPHNDPYQTRANTEAA